jgi:hypothetical protein
VPVQTTGATFPTAGTLNGASNTGMSSDNGTLAALSGASGDVFVASGFDFSDIPSSAIIRGIEVVIERRSDTANQARDNTVTLVNLAGGAANKARGGAWPNAIATATYGGASDLWGNASISVSDLQDSDFGVMVIADRLVPATAAVGGIDYITVNVSYIERDTVAYVWDGTTDQEITIRHVAVLGGDESEDSAFGYLTITCPQNADKTRIIDVGDQIRDAALGAGNLLAVVAARDEPIWFPGQDDIDNNASAYKYEASNFYASDDLDAAYIVCGVGPAVCFDGARTIRIRTNLPAQEDNPRHVARHGEKLALGFFGGTLALSLPGDPLDFRSSEGAVYVPVGDRIMGLRGRADDELLIPLRIQPAVLHRLHRNHRPASRHHPQSRDAGIHRCRHRHCAGLRWAGHLRHPHRLQLRACGSELPEREGRAVATAALASHRQRGAGADSPDSRVERARKEPVSPVLPRWLRADHDRHRSGRGADDSTLRRSQPERPAAGGARLVLGHRLGGA